jgi:hypothetical protein
MISIKTDSIYGEVNGMQIKTVEFAVTHKDGRISKIGKAVILQPKIRFGGGSVKWYKDKPKQKQG